MQKGRSLDPGERLTPQTPGSVRKAVSNKGFNVDTTPVSSPASELSGALSGSRYEPPKCWPKTNRMPDISPAKRTRLFRINKELQGFLVAQGLRIFLPMQGKRVWAVVQDDPTCCGATKPVSHNYWVCAPQLLRPTCLKPMLHNKGSHRNEKPTHPNEE